MNHTPSQPERPEQITGWRSIARWPRGFVNLGDPDNESTDDHGTREFAEAVCRKLEEQGFGGDRVIFPISTRVEPIYATRTPAPEAAKCPVCGSLEVEADTPRTVYACGSSDYDQRPGTFIQKCTTPEAVAVMNLEIKDGEIVQAPTPPVEADKDAELARLRKLLLEVSETAWWCENNHASFQHGDILDPGVTFSVVLLGENGHCFHSQSPVKAAGEAAKWLNEHPYVPFPDADLTTARATIAERDKRIAELVGALRSIAMDDIFDVSMRRIANAALTHAAEGKDQA